MNRINARYVAFSSGLLLLSAVAAIGLLLPASPFFANGKNDPCVLDEDTMELRSFVSRGLEESFAGGKTSGTVTRIVSNADSSLTFFVERLDAVTRERTALRVESYRGDESLSVGDYVTIEGNFSKDAESKDYWMTDPIVTSFGENGYGPVEPTEMSDKAPLSVFDNGISVHALRFNVTSALTNGDYYLLKTEDDNGNSFFPLLIDTGDTSKNAMLGGKIHYKSSADCFYKAYGNIEWIEGSYALRVSNEKDLVYVDNGPKKIDLYAINDFHGAVEKISQLATFFKSKANGNHVFLNSGDMWQGSVLSNTNRGRLLTETMDIIGFDCFTLGNHEFDWGLDCIKSNKSLTRTPFLGANVYKYDQEQRKPVSIDNELVEPYSIKDLDNGLRVGIIGIIGTAQITSITSSNVANVSFVDPQAVVPDLASKLRNEKKCDVVVLDAHTGQSDIETETIASSVDAVFCAHTHQKEQDLYNGIPYIQGGSYGNYISNISISFEGGKITSRTASNIQFSRYLEKDAETEEVVTRYSEGVKDLSSERLGNVSDSLSYNVGVGRLVTKAIALESESQGYSIDLAICNKGRAEITSGPLTYGDLYSVLPFDNLIYIAEVSGSDLFKEAQYNYIYRVREGAFSSSGTYTIAVIDYLLLHQNEAKRYDYFSDGFTVKGVLTSEDTDLYNYRDITADYIRSVQNVDADEFISTTNRNNNSRTVLMSSVSF